MKKILILGAAGMLGHKLCTLFRDDFEIFYTVRRSYYDYEKFGLFEKDRMYDQVDVLNEDKLIEVFTEVRPDVVINCIGVIKQLKEAKDPILSIKINALLPHHLAALCSAVNCRFIHISTDCVFNGKAGGYTEEDPSNAEDLYGRTKYLGEVDRHGCLTLRTSIIGREMNTANGLIEWFLSCRGGKVKGFKEAIYTGFTTLEMAKILRILIMEHSDMSGLWQVSSDPIDKYTLLNIVKQKFDMTIEIEPNESVRIDRSLNSTRFRERIGYTPPSWEEMIDGMAQDPTPYDQWHNR